MSKKAHVTLSPAEALRLILDQVDYTNGNCGPTEMVAAVLSTDVIATCRAARLEMKLRGDRRQGIEEAAQVAERELRGHKPAGYDLWPDVPAAIRDLKNTK